MSSNQQQPRKLSPTKLAIGGLAVLVVCVGLAVAASFIIRSRNNADAPPMGEPIAAPDGSAPATVMMGPIGVPLYPGAQPDTGDVTMPPPGGMGFVILGATPGDVMAWYRTVLPEAGLTPGPEVTPADGVDQSLVAVAGDGSGVRFDVWDAGDGQVTLVIAPAAPPQPTAGSDAAAPGADSPRPAPADGEQPLPVVTEPLPDGLALTVTTPASSTGEALQPLPHDEAPPTPARDSPAEGSGALSSGPMVVVASVDPAVAYAGTLTRVKYTVTVSGQGAVALAARVPAGVMVQVSTLPSNVAYDPVERTLSWGTTLASGVPMEISFSAVTDLLAGPGEALLKVVAESPGQQPVIQVATLTLQEY